MERFPLDNCNRRSNIPHPFPPLSLVNPCSPRVPIDRRITDVDDDASGLGEDDGRKAMFRKERSSRKREAFSNVRSQSTAGATRVSRP